LLGLAWCYLGIRRLHGQQQLWVFDFAWAAQFGSVVRNRSRIYFSSIFFVFDQLVQEEFITCI